MVKKPHEMTDEELNKYSGLEVFDARGCGHAAQKKLMEYLGETCTGHLPCGWLRARIFCKECILSLLNDFGMKE